MIEFWGLLGISLAFWTGCFTWFATQAYNDLRAEFERIIQR